MQVHRIADLVKVAWITFHYAKYDVAFNFNLVLSNFTQIDSFFACSDESI